MARGSALKGIFGAMLDKVLRKSSVALGMRVDSQGHVHDRGRASGQLTTSTRTHNSWLASHPPKSSEWCKALRDGGSRHSAKVDTRARVGSFDITTKLDIRRAHICDGIRVEGIMDLSPIGGLSGRTDGSEARSDDCAN